MKFPTTPRVEFAKNPLAEVICQIRFPRQFTIEESLPVELQRHFARRFPLVEQRFNVELTLSSDSQPPVPTQRIVYDFATADRGVIVSLASDFVAVVCRQYRNWEQFAEAIEIAWGAVRSTYGISLITRLGLRYRDVIDRDSLGLSGHPWSTLLQSELLGFLASDVEGASLVSEATSTHLFQIEPGFLRLNCGVVRSDDGEQAGFLIDSDFYLESQIDGNENVYMDILRAYNVEAGNLFRWSIKDRLREALSSPAD